MVSYSGRDEWVTLKHVGLVEREETPGAFSLSLPHFSALAYSQISRGLNLCMGSPVMYTYK